MCGPIITRSPRRCNFTNWEGQVNPSQKLPSSGQWFSNYIHFLLFKTVPLPVKLQIKCRHLFSVFWAVLGLFTIQKICKKKPHKSPLRPKKGEGFPQWTSPLKKVHLLNEPFPNSCRRDSLLCPSKWAALSSCSCSWLTVCCISCTS